MTAFPLLALSNAALMYINCRGCLCHVACSGPGACVAGVFSVELLPPPMGRGKAFVSISWLTARTYPQRLSQLHWLWETSGMDLGRT